MTVEYDEYTMRTYSIDDVDEMFYEYKWLRDMKKEVFFGVEKQILDQKQARVAHEKALAEDRALHNQAYRHQAQEDTARIAREDAMIREANRKAKLDRAKKTLGTEAK